MWDAILKRWNLENLFEVALSMLSRLVDIRQGEWRRLLPIALAYAFVLASVYMLKPARNALFLDKLGIGQLPYVLVLVALVGGASASLYARLTTGVRIDRLITGTFAGLAGILFVFFLLLKTEQSWVYYLFYVWVNLYGLLSISLLWLLANSVFHAREARRLFGFIGTGGIAGAVLGGMFTGWAVEALGTENLLLVCVGLLFLCMGLLRCVKNSELGGGQQTVKETGALEAIRLSPLVRYMVGIAGVVAIVAAIADVQFNGIVDATFVSKDEKAAFFGNFFAYLNGFAFLFQLLITPRILNRLGVGGGMAFLPVSMGIGALGILAVPGLWGGIAVKVGDIGFRHSVHKSAFEVLFLPVPSHLKKRAKVFIDTTVDNLATGTGAVLVLVLTGVFGLTYREMSFVSMALVIVWCVGLWPLRRAYVDAFRQALERREMGSDEFRVQLADGEVIDSLLQALQSENPRQISYALDLLVAVDRDISLQLMPLLNHSDAEIRERALLALSSIPQVDVIEPVLDMLEDDVPEVRLEAMHFLQTHSSHQNTESLQDFLRHENSQIRSAALGYMAVYGSLEEKQLIDIDLVGTVVQSGDPFERSQMARLLGVLNRVELSPFFSQLKKDPSLRVIRETMLSLGQVKAVDEVFWLLEQLANAQLRVDARQAFALMGPDILGILSQRLDDTSVDMRIRRHIPRVMGDILDQQSVDLLLVRLDKVSPELGYWVIKALSKLRAASPDLVFDDARVDIAFMQEIQAYYEFLQVIEVFRDVPTDDAWRLLNKAILEHQSLIVERLFRLLGLLYASKDMYHAYLGVVSVEKNTRAQALEFLDNVLEHQVKDHVLNLLDPESRDKALQHGRDLFGYDILSREDGLRYLIGGTEPWLQACAMNCVQRQDTAGLRGLVELQTGNDHPLISETANLVMDRLHLQA
ncbi:MAG: AAA family ATP:ADP antiporter [Candidatus Latescibacterota bacterium]|jgi:AAA family ATP:ADP antiporter